MESNRSHHKEKVSHVQCPLGKSNEVLQLKLWVPISVERTEEKENCNSVSWLALSEHRAVSRRLWQVCVTSTLEHTMSMH